MLKAVNTVLEQNNEKISGLAALVATVTLFGEKIKEIDTAQLAADADTKGATQSREDLRESIEEEAYYLSVALLAIANSEGDIKMAETVKVTESELMRQKEGELITTVAKLLQYANNYADKLKPYAIEAADVKDLEDMSERFNATQGEHRSTVSERKAAKENLEILIRDAKELLTSQLDLQMELLGRREPMLLSAYRSARMNIDYGNRHDKKAELPKS